MNEGASLEPINVRLVRAECGQYLPEFLNFPDVTAVTVEFAEALREGASPVVHVDGNQVTFADAFGHSAKYEVVSYEDRMWRLRKIS